MSGGIQMHAIFMTQQLLKALASVINTWKAVSVSSPGVGSTAWPGAVWTQSFWSRQHTGSPPKCFRKTICGTNVLSYQINLSFKWPQRQYNPTEMERLKFYQSFIILWKLLDELLRWDNINTLQVGYTVRDMSSKHFISLQEITHFHQLSVINLIKSLKTKNEQHFLRPIQNWANTQKHHYFSRSPL